MRSSFRKSSLSGASSAVSRDPLVSRVGSLHCRNKQGGERRKIPLKTRAPSIDDQSQFCNQTDEILTKVGLDQGRGLDSESDDNSPTGSGGGWQMTEKEKALKEAEEDGWMRDLNGVKIAEEEPWEAIGGGRALPATGLLASVESPSNSDRPDSDTLPPAPFRRPR